MPSTWAHCRLNVHYRPLQPKQPTLLCRQSLLQSHRVIPFLRLPSLRPHLGRVRLIGLRAQPPCVLMEHSHTALPGQEVAAIMMELPCGTSPLPAPDSQFRGNFFNEFGDVLCARICQKKRNCRQWLLQTVLTKMSRFRCDGMP